MQQDENSHDQHEVEQQVTTNIFKLIVLGIAVMGIVLVAALWILRDYPLF
jgi:hypothetical protein